MKILSIIYGNPCAYSILEDGKIIESKSFDNNTNPVDEFRNNNDLSEIRYFATTFPESNLIKKNSQDYKDIQIAAANNDGQIYCLGNNQSIASNSYFSSKLKDSIIITLMDEGEEQNRFMSSATIWEGKENLIRPVHSFESNEFNIIRIWSNIAQTTFNLKPSLESFSKIEKISKKGDSEKYSEKMWKMITENHDIVSMNLTSKNIKSYFNLFSENGIDSENKEDIAAAIQKCTSNLFITIIESLSEIKDIKNICLSGLASFNKGSIKDVKLKFPDTKIYTSKTKDLTEITNGAAMYVWNIVLDDNIKNKKGEKDSKNENN